MNGLRTKWRASVFALSALGLVLGMVLMHRESARAAQEETFPVLKIGTITYSNVTVTTKARKYIFILHSSGMANIRVADLPPDMQQALGYTDLEKKEEAKKAVVSDWAKQTLSRFQTPKVMAMEQDLKSRWQVHSTEELKAMIPANREMILTVLAAFLIIYLCVSYCWMLICRKSGQEPGILIWLPLLQIFPILRAAGMSPLWFLGFFVPVLNILTWTVLCFRVAKARGKGPLAGFLFWFGPTTLFAFLYLAFSEGSSRATVSPTRIAMKFGAA